MATCTAKSKRGTQPCKAPAIKGGSVCVKHGGAAPQVKASAAARLAAMVDPALGVLYSALKDKKQPKIAFDAARDVLDRNGHKAIEQIKLTVYDPGKLAHLSDEELIALQVVSAKLSKAEE